MGSELSTVEFLWIGARIGLAGLSWRDVKYCRFAVYRERAAKIERINSMGYVISLGVGFAVGLLYWLLKVQSPAPPLIALCGLLGMVLGEHAIPVVKAQLFAQTSAVQVAEQTQGAAVQKPAPGATKEGG
jgi:XapX domain-containing protein